MDSLNTSEPQQRTLDPRSYTDDMLQYAAFNANHVNSFDDATEQPTPRPAGCPMLLLCLPVLLLVALCKKMVR